MPFYDYKCQKCGKTFEVIHGMNDKSKINCAFCDNKDTQRIFNTFGRLSAGQLTSSDRGSSCSSCSSGICSTCRH